MWRKNMKITKRLMLIMMLLVMFVTAGCNDSKVSKNNNENKSNVTDSVTNKGSTKEDSKMETDKSKTKENDKDKSKTEENKESNIGDNNDSKSKNSDDKNKGDTIDLSKIKPNEAGQVMVLMYHSISTPEAELARTPDNFRKDLQILYDKGYRPISLRDYVTGNITTKAGYTPVVITFDDGWQNNFNIIKDKKGNITIDPDCAVAILEKFHSEHPDFPLEATFFINDNTPFGQKEYVGYKLKYIVDKGMDIGNHTATHVDFLNLTHADGIQREIADIKNMVNKYIPDYEVNTLALPYGNRPKNKDLYVYLEKGKFNGVEYRNIAILNVGWDPNRSPYHIKFNPMSIHRIWASDLQKYVKGVGIYDWIKRFDKGERTRYISDGNPNTITIPKGYLEVIDKNRIGNRKVITY
ncbi:polysaccharide deacetylase [Clostridium tepidiprofundi DSM 19306]|uniref:Polysaccharide deacetylase n=1 Tax=Clostridium tepidiprofundi DSM 19306 TaxID=1121338 RepID=A0A151B258_9CLOT|nr:polysaccharide deacetylase family protein [Clostridium tepidiprofundi]KYH34001.1 polysaccharide deacetylase [Clostridium tepidiprofundi DSM 19306]